MGKKGKGGGKDKGPKEDLPTEAESLLLLRIQLLEEKLAKAQEQSDTAVVVQSEVTGKMTKEAAAHKDHVEYLNLQYSNKEAELRELADQYAQLQMEKEMAEKRLSKELGDMKAALDASQAKLADSEAQVSRLSDQVVEIGSLRANAASDTSLKGELEEELAMVKHQLHESNQHLQILAVANDRIVGEDGSHALPLLLVEAIRLNIHKPVLCEQAMTALQYVLSGERHADSELIRRRGGVDQVLNAMTTHAEVAELQSSACGLLWKLGYADPPSRQTVIKVRSNPALVAPPGGNTRSPNPPGVGRPATVSAHPMARRAAMDEVEVKLTTKEQVSTQAMRLVLQSMEVHSETALVQEYGCGTLYNISLADPTLRGNIATEGGVAIVLQAMRAHPMETGLQINACALLKELADVQKALPLIEEGGGRQLLLSALQNHQYNEELLGRATEALRYLPEAIQLPDDV